MNKIIVFSVEKAEKLAKSAAQRFEAENLGSICEVRIGTFEECVFGMSKGCYDVLLLDGSLEDLMGKGISGYFIWGSDKDTDYSIAICSLSQSRQSAEEYAKIFLAGRFLAYGFTPKLKSFGNWNIKAANMWDEESRYYSIMTLMEINGTNLQLDAIPLDKNDVVLDCGCGPGRIAIQVSKRVKKVICLDNSYGMMEECKKNCKAAGVTNVEFVLADWQETEIGTTIPEVDVIIQARGGGGRTTFEMLRKAARKYAVSIIWAEGAPNLPESRGKLFKDCYIEEDMEKFPELRPIKRPQLRIEDKLKNSGKKFTIYDKLPFDAATIRKAMDDIGAQCKTTTVNEGWDRLFETKQDAYDWLIKLSRHPELVNMEKFYKNVDSFLTKTDNGWYFFLPTASDVTWFKTR